MSKWIICAKCNHVNYFTNQPSFKCSWCNHSIFQKGNIRKKWFVVDYWTQKLLSPDGMKVIGFRRRCDHLPCSVIEVSEKTC